jgi:hypothetical protein
MTNEIGSEQIRAIDIAEGEDKETVMRELREKQLAFEQIFGEEAENANPFA